MTIMNRHYSVDSPAKCHISMPNSIFNSVLTFRHDFLNIFAFPVGMPILIVFLFHAIPSFCILFYIVKRLRPEAVVTGVVLRVQIPPYSRIMTKTLISFKSVFSL